jgi:hypothetical protein
MQARGNVNAELTINANETVCRTKLTFNLQEFLLDMVLKTKMIWSRKNKKK